MKAEVFAYCEGVGQSNEVNNYHACDKYGVEAIFGRPLSGGEYNRMQYARWLVFAYNSQRKTDNAAQWIDDHPGWAEEIENARSLAIELGLING